jgi:diguanylate cyclase (GGDEF)-like protein/PAS domain S-box-containing protein
MNEFARQTSHHWESDSHIRVPTQPSQILLWLTDAAGRVEFLSPSWSRFTGIERPELLADCWPRVVHADDLVRLPPVFRSAAEAQQGFRRRLRLRRRDGVYCTMVIEGLPRLAEDGSTSGFAGFCLDLSPAEDPLLAPELADHRITELLCQVRLPSLALDREGRIIFFNQAMLDLFGELPREVISRPFFGQFAQPPGEMPVDFLRRVADCPPHAFESALRTASGAEYQMIWHVTVLRRESGEVNCCVLIGDDITGQRRLEEHLLLTHRVFETTDQAMVITDAEARIISVNNAFSRLTGYSREEAVGQNPRILQSGRNEASLYREMWRALLEFGHWHGDIWDRRKDGEIYPKFLSISAIRDSAGRTTHYSGIFYDITERKVFEEKLDRLAHYDLLTGIPNRSLLFDRLEQATGEAMHSGKQVGVLFIDLDHFKRINDSLGHAAGDQVLCEAARRIAGAIRRGDTLARLGGDEFAIVLPDLAEAQHAALVAEKILECMAPPFEVDGATLAVSPSIGISLFPGDHHQPAELLERADQAMYRAKLEGANAYRFYAVCHGDGA